MTDALRIGTRGSALARWQSDFVAARLLDRHPGLLIEVVEISSVGDEVLDQPLWQVEGTGFTWSHRNQLGASPMSSIRNRGVAVAAVPRPPLNVEATPPPAIRVVAAFASCGHRPDALQEPELGKSVGTLVAARASP